jgi:hypothetical protein
MIATSCFLLLRPEHSAMNLNNNEDSLLSQLRRDCLVMSDRHMSFNNILP